MSFKTSTTKRIFIHFWLSLSITITIAKEIYEDTTEKTDDEWNMEFYAPLFAETYKYLKRGSLYTKCSNKIIR